MEEVVVVNVSYFARSADGHLREFEAVSPRKIWKTELQFGAICLY